MNHIKGNNIFEIDSKDFLVFFATKIKIIHQHTKEIILDIPFKYATHAEITKKYIVIKSMDGKFLIIHKANYNKQRVFNLKFKEPHDYKFCVTEDEKYIVTSHYNMINNQLLVISLNTGEIARSIELKSKFARNIFKEENKFYIEIIIPRTSYFQIGVWEYPFNDGPCYSDKKGMNMIRIGYNAISHQFIILSREDSFFKKAKSKLTLADINLIPIKDLLLSSSDITFPGEVIWSNDGSKMIIISLGEFIIVDKSLNIVIKNKVPHLYAAKFSLDGTKVFAIAEGIQILKIEELNIIQ